MAMGITVLGGRAVAGKPSSALRALSEAFLGASRAVELPRAPNWSRSGHIFAASFRSGARPRTWVDEGSDAVLAAGVLRLLRLLAGAAGAPLILEDLRWADAETFA
jgi:hypothetical protein